MKRLVLTSALPVAAITLLLLVSAGCGRDTVKVYTVDSNDTTVVAPPAAAPATMPAAMPDGIAAPDTAGQPQLKYTLPDGWKEKPLSAMRVASFGVSGNNKTADVSVIPLGGMAGGDLANVNRWRGQVGLPALADADLQKLAEQITVAGQPADLYDIVGTASGSGDAGRILGVISHRDDTAWFFKMTGDATLVENQKPAFIAFLKSVEFGKPSAPAAMDMSQLPPSHPAIPGMTMPGTAQPAADSASQPAWTVPSDWKPGQLEQFLVAKFIVQGSGNATAAVNVSQLAGDGGGLLPNVNRWRAQLGQSPVTDDDIAKLPTIDTAGAKATVVDISGTDPSSGQPARLVGVVLPLNGGTWFYKLMGDANIVAQQKDAFIKFVQSAKYPAGQ